MGIDFYYMPLSAPCRAIMMTAKAIGVELNLKLTSIPNGDNRTPEYIKMNIRHTIPTTDDNGFYIAESRATMQYLMNKYAPGNDLYPTDPVKRAKVDEMLFFDCSVLYERFGQLVYPVVWGAVKELLADKKEKFEEALGWLDHYIKTNGGYVAGDKLTIADFSCVASVSSFEAVEVVDLSKYENITAWLAKCKSEIADYEETNGNGAKGFGEWVKPAIAGK